MTSPLSPDWWTPTKIVFAFFVGSLAVASVSSVWGDRRPVGNFFEEFLARCLYWGVAFGSIGSGGYVGMKTYERSQSKVAGWMVGIATFLVIGVLASMIVVQIPGIDWRFERLMSEGNDY